MPMPEVQKNKNERKIVESLDLHGYTKSQGIPLLTSFFERVTKTQTTDVWVLVITGSGAHSSNGPVLRNAVQALLEKRKMVYVLNRGKGSFTVNANSGQVLYPPEPPTDSKIILKHTSEPLPAMKASITRPNYRPADYPRPAEVAANEAIIQESRDSFLEEIRERKKEERLSNVHFGAAFGENFNDDAFLRSAYFNGHLVGLDAGHHIVRLHHIP